ncbi:MAG: hypothetical protein ACKVJ1_08540, partial [Verrucomicrobiia bacterium]
METLTNSHSGAKAGKRFRLTVKSAEEAVRVIREKLGDKARVLSVRQVGGEGLKKFISSPKLEVIAEIPSEDLTDDSLSEEKSNIEPPKPTAGTTATEDSTLLEPSLVGESLQSAVSENETPGAVSIESDSFKILAKTGFDSQLLSDIRSWSNWTEIKDLSLAESLKEITIGLSDRFRSLNILPTEDRIALIGAPGVGKTTTLCKFLAHEVFMNKKTPNVLKV